MINGIIKIIDVVKRQNHVEIILQKDLEKEETSQAVLKRSYVI